MVTKVKALLKLWGGNDKPARSDEHHGTMESGASYGASDTGLIAAMRLLLAVSALIFIYIDPLEPDRFVTTTYTTLGLYVLYSLAVYILALSQAKAMRTLRAWTHWLDLGWYSLLISLSSGTNSVFFFGFYFAIMVAGFRWGFWSGIRVTVASALAFAVIAGLTTPAPIELNRFLLRPTFLLVIGYMVARRGRFEIDLKRRLSLLKEIMTVSNPRFGTGRTIGMAMERLRLFYDADHCLVVLFSEKSERYTLRRASRADPEASVQAEVIDEELALRMLVPEPHEAIVFSSPAFFGRGNSWAFDTASRERVEFSAKMVGLPSLLDTESFVTVPLFYRHEPVGRLYLTARRWRAFREPDAFFVLHLIEQIAPVIDNIRLVDQLASDAAEQERQTIARDLHDSVLQPYIGLQMGLAAVCSKLRAGGRVSDDIDTLMEMTGIGISYLRSRLSGLRGKTEHESSLPAAVKRFAARFSTFTGIPVEVLCNGDIRINDRLAAEAFQMVTEGLSNIRRHTSSPRAEVRLACRDGRLELRITNEEACTLEPFTPRSITERAKALGGVAQVRCEAGNTTVMVEIPL